MGSVLEMEEKSRGSEVELCIPDEAGARLAYVAAAMAEGETTKTS